VATGLKFLLLILLHFLFGSAVKVYNIYDKTFLIELILNVLFAPLIFFVLNRFPSLFKSLGDV